MRDRLTSTCTEPGSAGRLPRMGPRRSRSRTAGFTFIEMILVVAILGILYAVGAVSFQGMMPKYRLRTTARRLGSTIEHTRLTAVSRGQWMGIHYNLTPRTDEEPYYQIIPAAPADYPNQPIEERQFLPKEPIEVGIRIARVLLADNHAVESGTINVLFSPMGNSGSHIVVFEDDAGRILSLKMNAISGMIDFVEGEEARFQHFEE